MSWLEQGRSIETVPWDAGSREFLSRANFLLLTLHTPSNFLEQHIICVQNHTIYILDSLIF